ncbi:MAG: amino acid ABC transporter substrate-binding protein [Caldilineaceae bacterium]|nr:amino acid ABC transporter substrate-binding protein [Caldilineaceae bacterium]
MSRRVRLFVGLPILIVAGLLLLFLLRGPESTRLLTRLFTRQDATWVQMQTRNRWRVGMDPSFPPFEHLDDSGVPVGYDVDLAEAIAADWGMQAEIIPIGYDSLVDALQAGRIDSVVSALPYDPRATRDVAFSAPYFDAGVRLVVRAGSPITSTASLHGSHVAVEWGSMGDMAGRRIEREGITLQLMPYATPDEAVDGLLNDPAVDALLIDQVSLRQAQGQGARIVAVGPALESNPYVIASPLRAHDLQDRIAATLAQFAGDGTLADLEARWFGPLPEGIGP